MELTETLFPSVRHKDVVKTHQTVSSTIECIHDEYTQSQGCYFQKLCQCLCFIYIYACFKFWNVSMASGLCIFNVRQQFPSFFTVPLQTVLCGMKIIQ